MKDVLGYGMIFILLYILYILFVIQRKKKIDQFQNSIFVKYLEKIYHLNIKTIAIKKLAHIIALTNAFIITITLYITSITDQLIFKMLLAFTSLIPMELITYHIIGTHYQRKERK